MASHTRNRLLLLSSADLDMVLDVQKFANRNKISLIVPMDGAAIGEVARLGIQYVLPDQFLSEGVLAASHRQASFLEKNWFLGGIEYLSEAGICWPDFDRHAMYWFWRTFTLSISLANELKKTAFAEICFISSPNDTAWSVYYERSTIWKVILENIIGGRSCAVRLQPKDVAYYLLKNHARKLKSRLGRLRRTITSHRDGSDFLVDNYEALEGKIAVAVNPREFWRFKPIIEKLSHAFSNKLALMLLTSSRPTLRQISQQCGIPLVGLPLSLPVPKNNIGSLFREGVRIALGTLENDSYQAPLRSLGTHFDYYACRRWPALISQYLFFLELMRGVRPMAVVVSNLNDAENQIPAQAAREVGIVSFAIPHAPSVLIDGPQSADFLLCLSPMQMQQYLTLGVSQERLIQISDAQMDNEYADAAFELPVEKSFSALVLLEPVSLDGTVSMNTRFTVQIETIQKLCSPPPAIHDKLSIFFKTHPGFPDLGILRAAMGSRFEQLLPPSSDLHSVLPKSDIVIALNYTGSALVHVLRNSKPLILLWTDMEATTWEYGQHYLQAAPLARTVGELWILIGRFIIEGPYRQLLRHQAASFARTWLNSTPHQGLGEAVQNIIGRDLGGSQSYP